MTNSQKTNDPTRSGGIISLVTIAFGLISELYASGHKKRVRNENAESNNAALIRASKITACATVIIAISGALTFGAAVIQAVIFNKQWHELHNTDEHIAQQYNLLVASERPYMYLSDVKLSKKLPHDPRPEITYAFSNQGQHAAILREINVDCDVVSPYAFIDPPTYDTTRTRPGRNVIGSAGTLSSGPVYQNCTLRNEITEDQWVAIAGSGKFLFFFGFLKYEGLGGAIYTKGFGDFLLAQVGDGTGFGDINAQAYNYERVEYSK